MRGWKSDEELQAQVDRLTEDDFWAAAWDESDPEQRLLGRLVGRDDPESELDIINDWMREAPYLRAEAAGFCTSACCLCPEPGGCRHAPREVA